MEWLSSVVQAARKAFSVTGRMARMSYAWERAGRRWLRDGSEMVSVQRRRMVVAGGSLKGRVGGIGLVICEGMAPVMEWLRARTEYLTVWYVSIVVVGSGDRLAF